MSTPRRYRERFHFIRNNMWQHMKCHQSGKFTCDLVSKIFIKDQPQMHAVLCHWTLLFSLKLLLLPKISNRYNMVQGVRQKKAHLYQADYSKDSDFSFQELNQNPVVKRGFLAMCKIWESPVGDLWCLTNPKSLQNNLSYDIKMGYWKKEMRSAERERERKSTILNSCDNM